MTHKEGSRINEQTAANAHLIVRLVLISARPRTIDYFVLYVHVLEFLY